MIIYIILHNKSYESVYNKLLISYNNETKKNTAAGPKYFRMFTKSCNPFWVLRFLNVRMRKVWRLKRKGARNVLEKERKNCDIIN